MPKLPNASAEQLSNHFVKYLYEQYRGNRHVRRVAAWVGLIVLGIQRVAGEDWKVPRNRQLRFEYQGRAFKVKYNHKVGKRGGIEVLEVLPGQGSPEGKQVAAIANLSEAEDFYNLAPKVIQRFIADN